MSTLSDPSVDDIIHLIDWDNDDSPYYTKNHKRFRKLCHEFVNKEVLPYIDKWCLNGDVPKEFYHKCYASGLYSRWYPKVLGGTPWMGSLIESFDPFYGIIFSEEFAKSGSAGLIAAGWIHALVVGPILLHGTMKQKLLMKDVITAKKFASLCVSEPIAGSDVRSIQTTAQQIENNKYVINGQKYWITGGMKADYFLTACRTIDINGNDGGISMFLVERVSLQGHDCSATAYVVYNNVIVSSSMIVGKPRTGFKQTMSNFNNERIGIIQNACGLSRVCVEESVRYAQTRKTFGKKLIQHQIIRHKLAEMARRTLATHAYLENILCS